jgi:hypothetical protein
LLQKAGLRADTANTSFYTNQHAQRL